MSQANNGRPDASRDGAMHKSDAIVVGGGLAGLTAAAVLARGGRKVTLYERSQEPGGRARSRPEQGYTFNLGPHALCPRGVGMEVLRELGVELHGGSPRAAGFALLAGRKHILPANPWSLLRTRALGVRGKLALARLFATIGSIDAAALDGQTVADWVDSAIAPPELRRFFLALFRLATYGNGPSVQSAGSALTQLQMGLKSSVLYFDGGWQTLVDGLKSAALAAGTTIRTGTRVEQVQIRDGRASGVSLADGTQQAASHVVLAIGPREAMSLVPDGAASDVRRFAERAVPVRAACLDVGLRRLPHPQATFALGIDEPIYLSVHSKYARLAPEGHALVHVARYLPVDEAPDSERDQRQLEGALDLVQPGWRSVCTTSSFLPAMTVVPALDLAALSGRRGRPAPRVADVEGLYVAGDWVGAEGLLADASLASGRAAAQQILRDARPTAAGEREHAGQR